jgi:hypothetical protein
MTPLQLSCRLLEQEYKYAFAMIDVPPELGDIIVEWGKLNIPDDALATEGNGEGGREMEQHVTVKYGMTTDKVPPEIYDIVHKTQPFPVYIGAVTLFRNPEFDVVKCDVESPWLRKLNAQISAAVPNEDEHPDYHPHVTIAYVKKGTCDRLEGTDIFKDRETHEFTASGMVFKGAGSDDDPSRANEVLLFSRVKQPAMAGEALALVAKWKVLGLTEEQMCHRLETGNWGAGEKYWYNKDRLPKLAERFAGCVTEAMEPNPQHYIDQLNPKYVINGNKFHDPTWLGKDYMWVDTVADAFKYASRAEAERVVARLKRHDRRAPITIEPVYESEVDPQHYVDELKPPHWTYQLEHDEDGNGDYWRAWYCYDGERLSFTERRERSLVERLAHAYCLLFNKIEREHPFSFPSNFRHRADALWIWYRQYTTADQDVQESGLEPPLHAKPAAGLETSKPGAPFDRLPFPSHADDMQKFLRQRRKKRAERPVL